MHLQPTNIQFDDFLSTTFNFPFEWMEILSVFRTIANSSHFQKLLDEYALRRETQTERRHLFNKLSNYALEVLVEQYPSREGSTIFCRRDHVPTTGSLDERFPDCAVIHKNCYEKIDRDNLFKERAEVNSFHWSEMLAFGKIFIEEHVHNVLFSSCTNEALRRRRGRDTTKSRQDALTQCANHVFGILSHSVLSTQVFDMLITGGDLELLFYNQSLPPKSACFNLLQRLFRLVTFLYCLQHSIPGPLSSLLPPGVATTDRNNLHHLKATLYRFGEACMPFTNLNVGGVNKSLSNPAHNEHALIGRGTRIIRFTITKNEDKHGWMLHEHLPIIVRYKLIPQSNEVTNLQDLLSRYLNTQAVKYEYKNRTLQVLATMELFSLTKLTNANTLLPVIKDVFSCYRWVYEKTGIMHRDISQNNLMYREEGGKLYGVIIDSALSFSFDRQKANSSSKLRIGTSAYMAIDLLQPFLTKHLYRHDLESLFYVVLILVSRYDGGREIENAPLHNWFKRSPEGLRELKTLLLWELPPLPTSAFQNMDALLLDICELFRAGYSAQVARTRLERTRKDRKTTSVDRPVLDTEFDKTLGGHVNFDKFQAILFGHICQ